MLCWSDIDEALTLGPTLNQEPTETMRKIGQYIHPTRSSIRVYNVVFNVSRVDEGKPLVFLVGDKISPTKDVCRLEDQVKLYHINLLKS